MTKTVLIEPSQSKQAKLIRANLTHFALFTLIQAHLNRGLGGVFDDNQMLG